MTGVTVTGAQRRVAVIGGGAGGLALAIRLQASGIAVTLIEARIRLGGRAEGWEQDGFVWCRGPTAIAGRAALDDLWSQAGARLDDDLTLLPIAPLSRNSWPDGTVFDICADETAMLREIARVAPGDLAGYDNLRRLAQAISDDFSAARGPAPFAERRQLLRAMPAVLRHQGWRTIWSAIAQQIKDTSLREALAALALHRGANPFTASALGLDALFTEQPGGLWWPEGGMDRLAAALAKRFSALGGTIRLHDPVTQIHSIGNRVHEVETQSGWREPFDAVASNADPVHTYRDLLGTAPRRPEMTNWLRRRRFAPGMFVVHFALDGTWPGIPHQMTLFGPRFREQVEDIYTHGVLPQKQLIWLAHPSVTDPSLTPPGTSVFQAAVPVAHLGKLPIDWEIVGPMLEQRVLDEVGRRLVPDIDDRIIARFHQTPRDLALDYSAYRGSAYGLDPQPLYGRGLPLKGRDSKLSGLYLVGAATQPGGGWAGAVDSARLTAGLMLEDLT